MRGEPQGAAESTEKKTIGEQAAVRLEKLAELQAAGADPFAVTSWPQDIYSDAAKAEFVEPAEGQEGRFVVMAGRLMSKRVMGKASFAHVQDYGGTIQVYVRRDDIGEAAS